MLPCWCRKLRHLFWKSPAYFETETETERSVPPVRVWILQSASRLGHQGPHPISARAPAFIAGKTNIRSFMTFLEPCKPIYWWFIEETILVLMVEMRQSQYLEKKCFLHYHEQWDEYDVEHFDACLMRTRGYLSISAEYSLPVQLCLSHSPVFTMRLTLAY